MQIKVILEPSEDGGYTAIVPYFAKSSDPHFPTY